MCFVWISEQIEIISGYLPVQQYVIGVYNRDGKYLLRGTNWVFK